MPEPVGEAIIDAVSITMYEFHDQPGADLRTAVLPKFYLTVADLYCDYRTAYPDGGVEIRFNGSDGSQVSD